MRNLVAYMTPVDIENFVGTLWKSKIFQNDYDNPDGYLRRIMKQFVKLPRFFADANDEFLEYSHFSVWWNVIMHRPGYTNPAVSDLYYLHEIAHAIQLGNPDPTMTWPQFYKKFTKNEFNSSMETEVFVYFELPGLREISFPHEIWVDRFITTLAIEAYSSSAQGNLRAQLRKSRLETMRNPDPFDFFELQIANYLSQNLQWARLWANHYQTIESHMRDFTDSANPGTMGSLDQAWRRHINWLERGDIPRLRHSANTHEYPGMIIFPDEAKAFADLYAENKKKYGNIVISNQSV